MVNDTKFMQRALSLAKKGQGQVHPNPLVGAVIVRNGQIIGEGAHWKLGLAHAEINALESVPSSPEQATMYVNLEPCTYHGRTPPCVPAIIQSGVTRVVIGITDPNPRVNGKGVRQLRDAGIDVEVGVLEAECRELNRGFIHRMEAGVPWVTLKLALTIDGFIADTTGESRWITGPESREQVHVWRSEHNAVLVGANTVVADDPQLTVRKVDGKNPVRVIVDSGQTVPADAQVLNSPLETETILFTANAKTDGELFQKPGVHLVSLEQDDQGMFQWEDILENLAEEHGILSVFAEGGAGVASSLIASGFVNELVTMIAPKIIGRGLSPFSNLHLPLADSQLWRIFHTGRLGNDSYVRYRREKER